MPPPNIKQIEAGFAPQMPLEAWLAVQGAFENLKAAEVAKLDYWVVRGGAKPVEVKSPIKEIDATVHQARDGLLKLIDIFSKESTPYLSRPRPAMAKYDDYDLLARVKEWRSAYDPLSDSSVGKVET